MRIWMAAALLLVAALAGAVPGAAGAARPDAFELKGRAGSLGRLPCIVVDDGAAYVSAPRLAALLGGAWTVKDGKATLTVGKRTAQFFFFKQKTAYEVLLCDWSSDVCSSDLAVFAPATDETGAEGLVQRITDAVARTAAVKLRAGTSTAPAGTRPSGGRSSTNLHLPAPPSPTELLDRARLALN